MDELVRFLVHQPTAITKLLAQHTEDGLGHCRACRNSNQRGYLSWPCVLHESASLADDARTAAALSPRTPRR